MVSETITFEIDKIENLKHLSNLIAEKGNTKVKVKVFNNSKNLTFKLSENRKISADILKVLKNEVYLRRMNF